MAFGLFIPCHPVLWSLACLFFGFQYLASRSPGWSQTEQVAEDDSDLDLLPPARVLPPGSWSFALMVKRRNHFYPTAHDGGTHGSPRSNCLLVLVEGDSRKAVFESLGQGEVILPWFPNTLCHF